MKNIRELYECLIHRKHSITMWIGLITTSFFAAFTATGGDVNSLTSWKALLDAIMEILKNPFLLGTFIVTIVAVVNNPTNRNGL